MILERSPVKFARRLALILTEWLLTHSGSAERTARPNISILFCECTFSCAATSIFEGPGGPFQWLLRNSERQPDATSRRRRRPQGRNEPLLIYRRRRGRLSASRRPRSLAASALLSFR